MQRIWTTAQVRAAEDAALASTPAGVLMRRAAAGVALHARRLLLRAGGRVTGRRVTLLVGAGNNGGDALWAGSELRRRGAAVTAVLLDAGRAHPAGLAALRRTGGRVIDAAAEPALAKGRVRAADLVIDGIVGISARGPLRPAAAELVDAAQDGGIPILAVDLPSGVDPDTGVVDGPAVTAAATVTFGALKPVHVLAPHRCGPVHLVDIGLGPYLEAGDTGDTAAEPHLYLPELADVADRWPVPGPTDDKYTQGVTGVAAGSAVYPGAAVLATGAAVLATSGMVRYAGPAADVVRGRWPEAIAAPSVADTGRVQAWVVGPGIGTDAAGRTTLAAVLAQDVPTVVDADAITLLAAHPELRPPDRTAPLLCTPHDREFARLTGGKPGADRVAAARTAAADLDATVLLKGNVTIVAEPGGRALAHPYAEAWAATAGSGDVLSGLLGALLAAGADPWWAAGCAAWVHDMAASAAASGAPAPASRLLDAVPAVIRAMRSARSQAAPPGRMR
ncbi:MAG: YjeF-related protein [Pseudonocardia sp.]|nr:YjeF-related protein [Pseudonocardia sp.]